MQKTKYPGAGPRGQQPMTTQAAVSPSELLTTDSPAPSCGFHAARNVLALPVVLQRTHLEQSSIMVKLRDACPLSLKTHRSISLVRSSDMVLASEPT